MNREQKAAEIENLKDRFCKAALTILADFRGLSVADMTSLRAELRRTNASFKVVKNRLARIAIQDTPAAVLSEHFVQTTAIATTEADPTGPARILTKFAKDNENLKIKIGVMDGQTLDEDKIKELASLPSKEELVAKLMALCQAPLTNLVNVLSQIPRQLVNVLSAIKDKKQEQ